MREVAGLLVALVILLPASSATTQERSLADANDAVSSLCRRGLNWFSRDKGCHFVVSAAGAAGIFTLARQAAIGTWPAAAVAATVMGAIGYTREVLQVENPDNRLTQRFLSRRDLVWNAAGILIGIWLSAAWQRRRTRNPPP